jgi:hypothetical protein
MKEFADLIGDRLVSRLDLKLEPKAAAARRVEVIMGGGGRRKRRKSGAFCDGIALTVCAYSKGNC